MIVRIVSVIGRCSIIFNSFQFCKDWKELECFSSLQFRQICQILHTHVLPG